MNAHTSEPRRPSGTRVALIPSGGGLGPLWCAAALAVTVLSSAPSPAGAADGPIAARSGFRRLAANALTVIPPRTSSDSRAIRGDLLEVTEGLKEQAWQPHRAPANTTLVEQSRNLEFQRDIWCLEFAFKPPRMIDIDVPTTELRMQRKRIWYLVYRVRNVGGVRTVIDKDDPTKRTDEPFETPVRFLPHFVLESMEGLTEEEGETAYRSYLDRVVPGAMGPIRRREDPSRELLDSAGMAAADIPPGEERWGVAVWEDVDPRIDFFTISVRGLTNAIRWRRRSDATFARDKPPASGMEHALKTLRLDFWRPGDDRSEAGEEMSVGSAGMFERMKLGGKVLEAVARPRLVASRPVAALADLGLSWSDLLVPPRAAGADRGGELVPLASVLKALAAVPDPAARGPLARGVFGDLGVESLEQVSRALMAPAAPDRDAVRRQALEAIELTPDAAARTPLESLAKVLETLAATPAGRRGQRAEAFFGPAAGRLDGLVREVSTARTLAALEDLDIKGRRLTAGDGLAAFDEMWPALRSIPDAEDRGRMLAALFGPRGPALYDQATAVPEGIDDQATAASEGIDHAWVFKYEVEGD